MKTIASCTVVLLFALFVTSQAAEPLTEAEQKEQKVVDRFWTLLEKTPRRGTSLDRVYGYYVDTGRTDELIDRCQKLTEIRPDDAKTWLLLGLVLSRRSDDAATVEAFEKARSLDKTEPLAPFYLGEAFIAQGRLQDAAQTLEDSLQRSLEAAKNSDGDRSASAKDVLAVLQTLGRVYERFGDRENSARIWTKLEELFPGDVDILVRIAETLEEEGKFDEALSRYLRLAEMSKNDRFARVQYTLAAADIKIRLGNKQDAIDDFEKLLEELSAESWLAQSIRDRVERIFVRQADYAGLAGYYQKRLGKHPGETDTVRRLAIALIRLSRTDEAKKLLTETLEKAPSNIPLRLAVVDLLVADREFDEVDRHYAKIDEIEPNNPDHVSQWGLAVMENKKLPEAERKAKSVQIWNRLIAAKPNDPAAVIMVADLMNTAKIHDEAEKLYKKAIELRPGDPNYLEYLGFFYHGRERKAEAVTVLRKIAEDGRRTAVYLAQLGGIFKSLGYTDESIAAFREALELDPKDFELHMQFAALLYGNEKFGDAEKEFLEAEKLAPPLSEEFARFLQHYVKLLQATNRLDDETKKLDGEKTAANFWRLAVYRSALNDDEGAVDAIERAVELQPNSNVLLEAAAKIFERGDDPKRAADIYQRLADADPQRRVDHLKRLANLQRELGEIDRAIETARLVMATGSGNAANSRFYADMLLNVGRREDGIEALRRAVRLDPTDMTTLSFLAEALFGAEQTDEALEILWRVFERTEDLQSKIGAVSRMSTYYQQSQRFDQLVERLRQRAKDAASRRESAYCLAQAFVTVSDFDAARNTLETLLLGADEKNNETDKASSDDTMLLSQLSKIAEFQGDLATAIRYQEMLCDQIQSARLAGPENERLLGLYQLGGEKNKAVDHLLRTLIDHGELRDQLTAFDGFLAREEYEPSETILSRIEAKHPGNWEVLYRRLMLDFWTKKLNAAEKGAATILELDVPRDEMSAKKKFEEEKRLAAPGSNKTPQPRSRYTPYQGYSPWEFGPEQRYYGSSGGSMQQRWTATANELLKTLFRDRLQLERHYYNRGLSVTTEPPKPQFTPEVFEDAKFAASLWKLRIALQRDLDAFRKEHPTEENKPETPANEENGLKLDGTKTALAELRKSLPADAKTTESLTDRLRLELFFDNWCNRTNQEAAAFSETNYTMLLFGGLAKNLGDNKTEQANGAAEAARRLQSDLEYELTLRGTKDWFTSVYGTVLADLAWEHSLDSVREIDIAREFDKAVKEFDAAEKFTPLEIETIKGYVLKEFERSKESAEKRAALDRRNKTEKIDWLLKCWNIDGKNALTVNQNLYSLIQSYSRLIKILQREGREDDIRRLAAALESVAERDPWSYSVIIGSVVNDLFNATAQKPFSITMLLMPRTTQGYQQPFIIGIPIGNTTPESDLTTRFLTFVRQAENRIDPAKDDERFETFSYWAERMKNAATQSQQKASKAPSAARTFRLPPDRQVDQLLNQYLTARSAALRPFCRPLALPQSLHTVTIAQPVSTTPPIEEGTALDKPLSAQQVENILATEKEIYRVLDKYFVWMNELDAKVKATAEPKRSARRPLLPSLGTYRSYFEHDNTPNAYMIQSILQGGQQANVMMAAVFEMTLSTVLTVMEKLDLGLKEAKFAEGVEPLKPDFEARFQKFIDEKKEHGTDADRKRIAEMKKRPETQPGHAIIQQGDLDVEAKLKELETQRKEAVEKGETVDPKILFALSLLQKTQGNRLESMRLLDAIPFTASGDVRFREQLALKYFAADPENKKLKERAEQAMRRLQGFQLKEDELLALRQTYNVLGKKEEADKILERLLLSANTTHTQYNLMQELQNAGDSMKDRAVQFALKVYRSPALRNAASMPNHDISWHLRNQCIEVLRKHGKLGEIVEQIEAQLKSAPGSLDIMMSMADIYQKANRKDDAKRIARQMAEKIPDDAQKMQNYANLLNNLDMKTEAAEWLQKSVAKNPEQILQNFWQYDNMFRESKQIPKLIEILKKVKPQRLAMQFGSFGYRIAGWLNNKEHADSARDLLKYVWDMEGASETERREGRFNFVQGMVSNANHVEFYPMFRTVIFDYISPPDEKTSTTFVYQQYQNPFWVNSWTANKGYCVACTFLDLAEKKNNLKELGDEIQVVVELHEKTDASKRNATAWMTARLLSVMLEARKKNVEKVVELFEPLKNDPAFKAMLAQQGFSMAIAQELNPLDDPNIARWAVEYFETELKRQHHGTSYVQRVIMPSLYRLYMKTDEKEKGRKLALEKLREAFKYLKLAGPNYNYQVGNHHYSVHELQESVVSMSKLLVEHGYSFDVMLVLREMYDGQKWVGESRKRHNYRYDEIDRISKEVGGKASTENIAEHLELLIPDVADADFDAAKKLPLMLGDYVATSPPMMILNELNFLSEYSKPITPEERNDKNRATYSGLRLADALKFISGKEPDRYENIVRRLAKLNEKFPEEPTVAILSANRHLIDGNRTEAAAVLHRLAEWSNGIEEKDAVSDAVYLGCLQLSLAAFRDEELLGLENVRKDAETLFNFTGRLIGRSLSRDSNDVNRSDLVRALLLDMRRDAPPELMEKFRPVFSTETLSSVLVRPSGAVTQNLSQRYEAIGDQLAEAVSMHAAAPVVKLFENVFKNGWPRIENNSSEAISRENALQLLIVYEKAMRAVRKSDAPPQKTFESLLEIVLPKPRRKAPFVADYTDLGGLNGYFRSPLIDLVDYAYRAQRTKALAERIAKKRGDETDSEENRLRLDAVEFALALRETDRKKIEHWIKTFHEAIDRGDSLSAKYALIVAVPFVKPYEDAEIDDKQFDRLIDLIDAAVSLNKNGEPCRRYTYYTIKSLYEKFADMTNLDGRIRWLRRFRDIDDASKMNGFRFTIEDRLYREGSRYVEFGKLPEAVSVLKYFSETPVDHFRRWDLTEYLAKLDDKLGKISETERKELLGDVDLSKVAVKSNVKREPGSKRFHPAPDFDLPKLPKGNVVYFNDFEAETGSAWSIDRRDTIPKVEQTFLGDFYEEPVRFTLNDLPEHRFVRIRFDLLMLGGIDGLVGQPRNFGVDVWGMRLGDGRKPIASTFSNFHKDPNNQKQSFPDDYPPEFGARPTWMHKVFSDSLWSDELEKGYYYGRHGAAIENKFGYEKDALYAVDMVLPHDTNELVIEFYSKFQDGPFNMQGLNKTEGEAWGIDHFQVELIDQPLELGTDALEKCFDALIGNDAVKAHAARWRLVAAGDASVKFIADWFKTEKNQDKIKVIRTPDHFDGFRIDRVLELVGTPEAEALRKTLKP